MDAAGNVVELADGVAVYPAGCNQADCAVTYAGGAVEMDQHSASFTLLPNLTWSDGAPLTADDSVFSYELARQAESPFSGPTGRYGVVPMREVDPVPRTAAYVAIDERTVRWVGLPGFRDPYYRTNFFTPLPRHEWGSFTPAELLEAPESARLPLGWGPYALTDWIPGERIVAERNPHYFRAGEGLPYFDRLVFHLLYGLAGGPVDGLLSGRCDMVTLDAIGGDWQPLLEAEAAGSIRLYLAASPVWEHLTFGINPAAGYERPDFFEDARVRRAFAYCLDRQRIMDETMAGLAAAMNSYVPDDHPLYGPAGLEQYEYDPAAGRALLEEAGWRDEDGDGVREARGAAHAPESTPFRVAYFYTASELRTRISELIAADLLACGIEVTPTPYSGEDLFALEAGAAVFGRRFDLAQFGWLTGAIPPCQLYLSSNIPAEANGWAGQNVAGYSNPAFDAACQGARAALPGTGDYERTHLEALRLFSQELPAIPLFQRVTLTAARPDMSGVAVDPTQREETWNIEAFRLADE